MATSDGQPASATTFNNAYISRTVDSNTVAKVDLDNAETTEIKDIQRVVNEQLDASGVDNQATTDANAKVYSSNNVVADGDNRKVAIGKLDAEFEARFNVTTGHDHDGVNSKAIDAGNLANVNNLFAEFQENTFDAAAGTSIDVSALFVGKTSGGDSITEGVITSAPLNLVSIVEKTNGGEIEDAQGDRVYARLTEAAGVWTLSFYTNEAGIETAHSLTSQDISFLYREVFNQNTRPTIGANVAAFDTLSAVGDIPDASPTQSGKVSTSAQTFAGNKNFQDGLEVGGVDVVDLSTAQTITNKTISTSTVSSSTLSNNSVEDPTRLDVKKDTEANLITYASTASNGQLVFATDTKKYYTILDTTLKEFGGDAVAAGGGSLDFFLTEDYSTTSATDFSTGNNATFLGGGVLVGTFADNNSTPIAGVNSLKFTQAVGSLNDYIASPVIDLDRKQTGNQVEMNLYYTYDGNAGDIQAVVFDVTNATELITDTFLAATNPTRGAFTVNIPETCTQLRYGFKVLTENAGAIFELDEVQFTSYIAPTSTGGGGGSGSATAFIYHKTATTGGSAVGSPTAFASRVFQTRTINVLEGDTSFISIGSNQITLDAGTYSVDLRAQCYRVGYHQARLYNITDSETALNGSPEFVGTSEENTSDSTVLGTFSITAQKTFELQHWNSNTKTGNGFGLDNNLEVDAPGDIQHTFVKGIIEQTAVYEPPPSGGGATVYGAVMESNPASIVSQTGTWLDSITRDSFGEYTIDYTSAGFTNIPFIRITREFRDGAHIVRSISNTSCSFTCYQIAGPARTENSDRIHVMAIAQD